jgi:hypothetical protein
MTKFSAWPPSHSPTPLISHLVTIFHDLRNRLTLAPHVTWPHWGKTAQQILRTWILPVSKFCWPKKVGKQILLSKQSWYANFWYQNLVENNVWRSLTYTHHRHHPSEGGVFWDFRSGCGICKISYTLNNHRSPNHRTTALPPHHTHHHVPPHTKQQLTHLLQKEKKIFVSAECGCDTWGVTNISRHVSLTYMMHGAHHEPPTTTTTITTNNTTATHKQHTPILLITGGGGGGRWWWWWWWRCSTASDSTRCLLSITCSTLTRAPLMHVC